MVTYLFNFIFIIITIINCTSTKNLLYIKHNLSKKYNIKILTIHENGDSLI
jgi:hypothetical protein